jgi:hypothetical protein
MQLGPSHPAMGFMGEWNIRAAYASCGRPHNFACSCTFRIALAWKGIYFRTELSGKLLQEIDAEIYAKALVESAPIIVHARCRAAN